MAVVLYTTSASVHTLTSSHSHLFTHTLKGCHCPLQTQKGGIIGRNEGPLEGI